MKLYPMVVDLSHWDPASDYNAVKADGIYGVIYKATEGESYTDETYVGQQHAAKAAGLLWGAYHFADGSTVSKQIDNFLRFAAPDPDELFCLDWEDNSGNTMSKDNAKTWITEVETALNRPDECVIYSGNTAKEALGDTADPFFGDRRLWLCHYTSGTPTWQKSWDNYWLWQFTDGQIGPKPHEIDGIGPCDINSFDRDGGAEELIRTWASGLPAPAPPTPVERVSVLVAAPADVSLQITTPGGSVLIAAPGVPIKVRQATLGGRQMLSHTRHTRTREGRGK
jgi:lysozyme